MKAVQKINLKIQQGVETRTAILEKARLLFGQKGYRFTSTDDILNEVNVTRGALYHHFKSKQEIFEEICHIDNLQFANEIRRWSWPDFKREWTEILELADDKMFIQIWIKDAPSVLSTEQLLKLDEEFLVAPFTELLQKAIDENLLKPGSATALANLFLGMINQALLVLSQTRAREKKAVKQNFQTIIENWLTSLEVTN
ncbi:MAG: TetR/AcrR family transcriptional regulator [Leptospiraceae bacterium]|nr:TetR/AcrR family transcriptional regulator [Leptospiraceae bacterium]MCB1199736.1 TetR/AcrR family transcriptional regulator [Leptospiraceae bacterium]